MKERKRILRNRKKSPVKKLFFSRKKNQLETLSKEEVFEGKSVTEKMIFLLLANEIFLIEKNT